MYLQTALTIAYGETLKIEGLAAFLFLHLEAPVWEARPKAIQLGELVDEGHAAVFASTVEEAIGVAISRADPVPVASLDYKPVVMPSEDQRRLDEYLAAPLGNPSLLIEKPPAYPKVPPKVTFVCPSYDPVGYEPRMPMPSPLPLSRASSGLPPWSPGPHTPLSPASSVGQGAPTAEEVFGDEPSDEGEKVVRQGRKRTHLALADDEEEEQCALGRLWRA